MPSSITALMVELDELRKVFGSKNNSLLQAILDANEIDDDDTDVDEFEEAEDGDEDIDPDDLDGLPSSQDALRHIILGEPWARGIGSKYGYMFLEICRHLGEQLDANSWGETRAEYVSAFDGVLRKVGITPDIVSMEALTCSPDIFPLPPRGSFPTTGSLTAAKAAKAAIALAAVDRAALTRASQKVKISRGAIKPEFVAESFEELQTWCETCAAKKKDLILFYF